MLLAAWLLAPRAAPDVPADGEDPPAAADEPSAEPSADARTLRVRLGSEVKELSMADYLTGVLRHMKYLYQQEFPNLIFNINNR